MSGEGLVASLKRDSNVTRTENSMPAYKSTLNACLDLFFLGASYRERSEIEVIRLFGAAFREDRDIALRILAYFRDVREGSGERRFFRTCITWLANNEVSAKFNIPYIAEFGRWDDLLCLIDTPLGEYALAIICEALSSGNALCAKWMPRKGRVARLLREHMGMYPKDYRKLLVKNTKVVETQMCNKQWVDINYEHVPSVANVKYNSAFLRNDTDRRRAFLEAAKSGKVTIKASVAFPHTIVGMMLSGGTRHLKEGEYLGRLLTKNDTAIAMWKNLPNVIGDGNRRLLFVSDTSGSMGIPYSKTDDPIKMSLGMGIYCSERLQGPFRNAFITFSAEPQLQYTIGNLYERLCQIKAHHPSNTNLYKVFKLVLDTVMKHQVPLEEMPTDVVICSDMEFDRAMGNPNDDAFKMIRKMYADSGYDMPNIVFWNVNARNDHSPIERDNRGVALISGVSQNAIKSVMQGVTTPVEVMRRTVGNDRYAKFLEWQSVEIRK
jgi:hypothetical protein